MGGFMQREFGGTMPDGTKVTVVCSSEKISGTGLWKLPRIQIKGKEESLNLIGNSFFTVSDNLKVEVDEQIHVWLSQLRY